MEDQIIWVVGEALSEDGWQVLGIFESEQAAIACCEFHSDFVAKLEAGVLLPRYLDEPNAWSGLYYPKRVEYLVDAANKIKEKDE